MERDHWLCQPCAAAGRVTEAAEVDHVTPLAKGGTDDERNLQAICVPCHRAKTLSEDPSLGASRVPDWLPVPVVPVTVVSGPPGSGKSHYVRERAAVDHLVLDLDVIMAELSGLPLYHAGDEWLSLALRTRNARLASLSGVPSHYSAAWLIVGAPTVTERRRWREILGQDASVVILAVDPEECEARTAERPPPPNGTPWRTIIDRWWARYSTGYGETVLS